MPVESSSLPGHNIDVVARILFKSSNGNYWMGTHIGLFQLEKQELISTQFNLAPAAGHADPGWCTGVIRSGTGKLYISFTNNVLIETEKDLSRLNRYSIPAKKNIYFNCIREDNFKNLWVGSLKGLYYFNVSTKKFTQPEWFHPDLYNSLINAVYCDRVGNTWVATRFPFGLYRYTSITGVFEKIKNDVTDHFGSVGENSRISFITEDDKHIWMISRLGGGIICYNKVSGDWSNYPQQNKHRNLLSKGLNYLLADNTGCLWMFDVFGGTGLIKYDYVNDSVSLFTRNEGLPSDIISNIIYDGNSSLWIETEYGLSQFDLKSQKIVSNTFFKSGPLREKDFFVYDSLSKSFIGVTGSQLLFYPVSAFQSEKKESLQPLIDKIWVNSKAINWDVNGQSLKLKPGETNISIDFTVVHYSNADKIRFAYQLSGADHDWKYTDITRSAQYAVLTPGKYIFRIKVADENGNWGQPYNSFSFTIVPHFWQTNFFKISFVLAIAGTAFYFFRRRIKHIRHEAEMKKQMAETEMMALRAQMNPHFIFNCLNSINNLIQSNEKEKATSYLARFAKLIRAILENSKHQLIPVWKDMETLKLYLELETLRFDSKFSYRFDIAEELQQGDYKIPPLLIQPFVENAIHHGLMNLPDRQAGKTGNHRELIIAATAKNGEIKFTIEDNGVGRQQAEKIKQLNKAPHLSLGQNITESRINLFNKSGLNESIKITDLVNNENEAAGTRVEITLENK